MKNSNENYDPEGTKITYSESEDDVEKNYMNNYIISKHIVQEEF